MTALRTIPLRGMPLVDTQSDLSREICAAIDREGEALQSGDVVVLAQKIVSKKEGRMVDLASVKPSSNAHRIATETAREPEMVQLILDESRELLRTTPVAIIARHRTGHVLANAGIDASNIEGGERGAVLLWPQDPDACARSIRSGIAKIAGVRPAVVIADSMGRAWRIGTVGTAIGCAGLTVVEDRRGTGRDLFGRVLQATQIAVADSVAAMAALAMGEGDEGVPAVLIRGAGRWVTDEEGAGAVSGVRPVEQDMFR
ncbi:coenzyme F420-0:L-glutamate ligase [Novosphingobium sp. M1R2S20]|uniref:Coenzyme F420-0:L-glutamate ligase n=1 Tax=Novosphingobium rhizovicinum TaxID=3228928 RepID=A0ABV3RC00_9SPHN